MRSMRLSISLLAALALPALSQKATSSNSAARATATAASTGSGANPTGNEEAAISSQVVAAVSSIVGASTKPNPSQFSLIQNAFLSNGNQFLSAYATQDPFTLIEANPTGTDTVGPITITPAAYAQELASVLQDAEDDTSAIPRLQSLLSGQSFSSAMIADLTKGAAVEAAATSAFVGFVKSELGVATATASTSTAGAGNATGTGTADASKGGAAPTGDVVGAVAIMAGAVGVVLL